jgi:hypothetical protein
LDRGYHPRDPPYQGFDDCLIEVVITFVATFEIALILVANVHQTFVVSITFVSQEPHFAPVSESYLAYQASMLEVGMSLLHQLFLFEESYHLSYKWHTTRKPQFTDGFK